MSPETQQRLSNWGCLLSLVVLIAGAVAAFLGRPAWLLPTVPIILISLLFWLASESARRIAARQRELEAFAESFRGFDGPVPTFDAVPAMGWPHFTLTFDSKEALDLEPWVLELRLPADQDRSVPDEPLQRWKLT